MVIDLFSGIIRVELPVGTAFLLVISHGGGLFIYDCPILQGKHELHATIADDIAIYNFDLVFAGFAIFEHTGTTGGLERGACPIKSFV
jgi:hypothetical protein